jgi:Flp pilus assembly protein TadG
MRRLILARLKRDEHGAVAVLVALAMAALLAAAALAYDIGSLLSERAQLQNGADAGAIAIAQTCATGTGATGCTAPTPKAQAFADANTNAGSATVRSVTVTGSSARVVLEKSMPLSFAATFGIASKTVSAAATASWGSPVRGPAVLPLTFASCSFTAQPVGTAEDLIAHQIGDTGTSQCTSSTTGQILPGGFGWLDESATCSITATAGTSMTASSNTGVSASQACAALLPTLLGQTVLLPVYDSTTGQGTTGTYHLAGWAEFQLLGWRFPSAGSQNISGQASLSISSPDSGLIGKFLGFASLDKRYTLGPPNPPYASIVALTE